MMNDNQPVHYLPERNPVTQQKHRREVLRQITFPLLIGVLLMLVLCVLPFLGADQTVSRWADISLIWLIIPMLFVAFVFLVLLGAIAYGVIYLIRILPVQMRRLQDLFLTIRTVLHKLTDKMVEPVLKAKSLSAAAGAFRSSTARQVREMGTDLRNGRRGR